MAPTVAHRSLECQRKNVAVQGQGDPGGQHQGGVKPIRCSEAAGEEAEHAQHGVGATVK